MRAAARAWSSGSVIAHKPEQMIAGAPGPQERLKVVVSSVRFLLSPLARRVAEPSRLDA